MTERLGIDQIHAFWTEQARIHGQSPAASWSDHMVIEMEIREMSQRLSTGDRVLDVGCANGYSTVRYATEKAIHIRGVDYVPEMVAQARDRLARFQGAIAGTVEFEVGDITALSEPADTYDKLVVTRVVINLADWERQLRALRECARVLRPGGLLLLSEATVQGWKRLNEFRAEWGLPGIPMPPFNLYLDQERLIDAVRDIFSCVQVVDFASTYYVGTRVLKPLLAQALGGAFDVANPDMHWNRWISTLPPWGDYGTQKVFVLQKR